VSCYSKVGPFSADVGSIQIFCRIRLTKNLSKPLYTEPLSYTCNVKLNRWWIRFCLFILLPKRRTKKEIIQNIYRYIVKNIKERIFFFYIVREENIRPQVFRDIISPPFFQHYEKIYISYHILSYYLQLCIYRYFV
jgi:hypothetical protein